MVRDQGSDMLSCYPATLYDDVVHSVATIFYDIEHEANRNVWHNISDDGLKGVVPLGVMAASLPSQPDGTYLRCSQLRDRLREHMVMMTPSTSPIFGVLSRGMHKETLRDISIDENETPVEAVWRLTRTKNEHRTKDDHDCVARCCAVVAGARSFLQTWSTRTFECAATAIESNMLATTHLPNIVLRFAGADQASAGEGGTTARNVMSTVDRTIRSCGANGGCHYPCIFVG